MNIRERTIELLCYQLAFESMGFYPKEIKDGDNGYKKRTEKMEGHNEALSRLGEKVCLIDEFINNTNSETLEDLLIEEKIFISINKENKITLLVNCNDVFYWACSDAEEIKIEELSSLKEYIIESNKYGVMLWCCRKRGMRPQSAWYKEFTTEEKILFDKCGPERK